jgi:GAF domain-containing protein
MTTTQAGTIAELQRTIADLRHQLSERDAALMKRTSRYGEHAAQQAATIDVLKVMSASPGDPQPVFDLIVERACACSGAELAALTLLDGDLLRLNATSGMTAARTQEFATAYPLPVSQAFAGGRAILTRDTVQVPDTQVDPGFAQRGTNAWHRSVLAVPLLRAGVPVGAIGLGRSTPGAFSAAQVELLKTFAEQAVIAIGSAETYRKLNQRTADLQESLEYQTATSDVLKVISRSTFNLQPVLDTVAETAARLCDADQAAIYRREGESARLVTNFGFPPEYETYTRSLGAFPIDPNAKAVGQRTLVEGRPVHVHDVAAVPGYWEIAITLGKQRTSLGVPLLREGETIGNIMLARQRVEPFTDRQIELVSTFADQAVIAIENTRLMTEQREALEQQTATAEVLQVINASAGDLERVFDTILEKAIVLCEASFGGLATYDGECFQVVATRGMPTGLADALRGRGPLRPSPGMAYDQIARGADIVHIPDITTRQIRFPEGFASSLNVDQDGARTMLFVALRGDNALFGAVFIYRKEVRLFSDKQVALLQNFAAQAVIAMDNARLIAEQREALEQQTATAEVLQVINASAGDLERVFDTILEKAILLCESSVGGLTIYDGEYFHHGATRGMPTDLAEALRKREPLRPSQSVSYDQIVRGADIVHIPDIIALGAPFPSSPNIDQDGARTTLFVALRGDDALLGVFVSTGGRCACSPTNRSHC